MPIASLNPFRKTAPSRATSTSVTSTGWPSSACGTKGFSSRWAVASAAERVIVITKSVATKPSRHRTNSLPCHQGSSFSSIAIEPSPWGLSSATRLYIGRAPNRVSRTRIRVASGERAPAARAAMPGW